jgi:hypothetical protein
MPQELNKTSSKLYRGCWGKNVIEIIILLQKRTNSKGIKFKIFLKGQTNVLRLINVISIT